MPIRPQTYFSLIQWLILFMLLLCSIFFSRVIALIAFSLFIAWKLYSLTVLPHKIRRNLSSQRLKKQQLRERFNHSPFSVNKIKTRLLELAPQWPTLVLLDHRTPTIFISKTLVNKLNDQEMTILIQWCFYLFEEGLAKAGLKIYCIFYPWFVITRWLDQWVFMRSLQKVFSCERMLVHFLGLLYYPIYWGHRRVLMRLCEEFGEAKVEQLRQKIYYIVHCHEMLPPSEYSYMLIDPEIININFKETMFGHLPTPELVMKGPQYGKQ